MKRADFDLRSEQNVPEEPISHDPELRKRVLFRSGECHSALQMLNTARLKSGQSFSNHNHPTMEEFFYVLEGRLDFELSDQHVSLSVGQALRISPGVPHRARALGDTRFLTFGVAIDP